LQILEKKVGEKDRAAELWREEQERKKEARKRERLLAARCPFQSNSLQ
jgi:hypothetical protein